RSPRAAARRRPGRRCGRSAGPRPPTARRRCGRRRRARRAGRAAARTATACARGGYARCRRPAARPRSARGPGPRVPRWGEPIGGGRASESDQKAGAVRIAHMTELAPALGLLAGALGIFDTLPYIRDTVRGATRPHRGTWLIWGMLAV